MLHFCHEDERPFDFFPFSKGNSVDESSFKRGPNKQLIAVGTTGRKSLGNDSKIG